MIEDANAKPITGIPNWLRTAPIHGWPGETVCGMSGIGSARIEGSHLEVHGVEYEAVEYITSPAPVNGDMLSTIQQWREADLANRQRGTPECSLDDFLKAVSTGMYSERWPLYSHPTLQEWHEYYELDASSNDEKTIKLRRKIESRSTEPIKGQCFFRAGDLIGCCSQSVIPGESSCLRHSCISTMLIQMNLGDIVCILIGFNWPIILRPQADSTYQVVSTAYIPRLCDCNGLLGSLEAHWRITSSPDESGGAIPLFYNTENEETFFEHPHLGSLPDGWVYCEEYKGSGTHNAVFIHEESGMKTWKDPRLSPEALKARGVPVKTLRII